MCSRERKSQHGAPGLSDQSRTFAWNFVRDHVREILDVLSDRERSLGAHPLPGLEHLEGIRKRSSQQARASRSTRTTVDDHHRAAVGAVSPDWNQLLFVLH